MESLINGFDKKKDKVLAESQKKKEIQEKINNKRDFAKDHQPLLEDESLSSHSLYFEDNMLDALLANKMGYFLFF